MISYVPMRLAASAHRRSHAKIAVKNRRAAANIFWRFLAANFAGAPARLLNFCAVALAYPGAAGPRELFFYGRESTINVCRTSGGAFATEVSFEGVGNFRRRSPRRWCARRNGRCFNSRSYGVVRWPRPISVDVIDPKFATVSEDHALGNRYLSNFRGRDFAPALPHGSLCRLDNEIAAHKQSRPHHGRLDPIVASPPRRNQVAAVPSIILAACVRSPGAVLRHLINDPPARRRVQWLRPHDPCLPDVRRRFR